MPDHEHEVQKALDVLERADPEGEMDLFETVKPHERAERPNDIGPEKPSHPHEGVRRGLGIQALRHGIVRASLAPRTDDERTKAGVAHVTDRMSKAYAPANKSTEPAATFTPPTSNGARKK